MFTRHGRHCRQSCSTVYRQRWPAHRHLNTPRSALFPDLANGSIRSTRRVLEAAWFCHLGSSAGTSYSLHFPIHTLSLSLSLSLSHTHTHTHRLLMSFGYFLTMFKTHLIRLSLLRIVSLLSIQFPLDLHQDDNIVLLLILNVTGG